jgi:photosystem II stability/assembly factor-like uncharacterized protein
MAPIVALALVATTAALPFDIAFTDGHCRGCEAQMLGAIQLSGGAVIWAQGFTPPGGAGEGEWTLLHSNNGGRSWRELRKSWSHNIETRAFFRGRRDGWIAIPNGLREESYYASTADGGRRWRPVRVPSTNVVQILYRGGGRGAAFANDPYTKKSGFSVTPDNGRHWRSEPIGGDMWVDQLTYSGPDTPVLAGCADHETVILASPDGGRHWSRAKIPQVSATPETIGCEAGVDGLAFPPKKPGFALVQRHSFPLKRTDGYASLWRTPDGGRHWTRVFFERHASQGPEARWFNGPYALGDLTLVFVATGTRGTVLYSRNNGENWSHASLPEPLAGCFAGPHSLTCMAGSKGFRSAVLTNTTGARAR